MNHGTVIQYMDDPAVALDADWRVTAINSAFEGTFSVGSIEGASVATVFSTDGALSARHAGTLEHYPDVGGVVEDGARHFDPDHGTIAAIRAGRDPQADDPDVGVFVDGDLRYFHLTTVDTEDGAQLLVFRDITAVKDREQDLDFLRQVMGRVLRHNLRNDLTVIGAQADAIAAESEDDRAEMAELIRRKSDELLQTSEKTRLIERAVESDAPVRYDLGRVVRKGIAAVREEVETDCGPISTDVPAVEVRAVPPFPKALRDTIENAVVYGEGPVEVTATTGSGWVTLTIDDDGPGVPQHELDALERRGETDLNHGSGAGLWLIYTTIQESRGDISFDTEDGTTVSIRLPRAD